MSLPPSARPTVLVVGDSSDAAIDYAPEGVIYALRSADPAGLRRGDDA